MSTNNLGCQDGINRYKKSFPADEAGCKQICYAAMVPKQNFLEVKMKANVLSLCTKTFPGLQN